VLPGESLVCLPPGHPPATPTGAPAPGPSPRRRRAAQRPYPARNIPAGRSRAMARPGPARRRATVPAGPRPPADCGSVRRDAGGHGCPGVRPLVPASRWVMRRSRRTRAVPPNWTSAPAMSVRRERKPDWSSGATVCNGGRRAWTLTRDLGAGTAARTGPGGGGTAAASLSSDGW